LKDLTDLMKDTEFKQFRAVVDQGGVVKALNGPGLSKLSRKELDELIDLAGVYGARGLAWVKLQSQGWQSPLAKYFPAGVKAAIEARLTAKEGDLLLFVADVPTVACTAMGQVRLNLAEREGLIPEGTYGLTWVTDFPLLEYDNEAGRFAAMHHPFTAPKGDLPGPTDREDQGRADLVLNGTRSASSIRSIAGQQRF
jgi:aspartyl-tRNA synthetase